MRDYVIMTDSSCDLSEELVNKYGIDVVPLSVTIEGKTFMHRHDWSEMSHDDFVEAIKNGATGGTAGTNIQDAYEAMKKHAAAGKDILYLSLSGGLSCSFQNACLAAEDIKDEFSDATVVVMDSKCVCGGLGLLCVLAAREREQGRSFHETMRLIDEIHMHIQHQFTVQDLNALSRSGRISHMTATVGSLLNIKPMLYIDNEGKIQSAGKARGRKGAVKQLLDTVEKNTTAHDVYMISHVDAMDDVQTVKAALEEKHPGCEILITDVGPVIGIHTGHQLLVVCSLGKHR